jgi:FAD/FMN-containing dehydrogenase
MPAYQSWGRYPQVGEGDQKALRLNWAHEIPRLKGLAGTLLPRGLGRSYGDSCLNPGGTLLDARGLDRFITFDAKSGLLCCEAGVSFEEILRVFVPQGWFLPTTPGTKFVTVGGAIANDVHGKNHHASGSFGAHLRRFELLTSDGRRRVCSRSQNASFFHATIGGLGLTGLITWAEFPLAPIASSDIASENIKTRDLGEFFELSERSEADWPFVVSWVDMTARGRGLGRGLFNRGRWAASGPLQASPEPKLRFPVDLPSFALNPLSIRAFNALVYAKQLARVKRGTAHYEPFFYPLDAILDWNRGYGKRGFIQWQCLVPMQGAKESIRRILEAAARSGLGSPVSVMKTSGAMPAQGLLSFMRLRGITLAMDFPMAGEPVLALCNQLDALVRDAGGCVYPGKDARMSSESFKAFFPHWRELAGFVDPKLSSGFWRRVAA